MAALTNYGENKVIDALFRGESLGAPATWYFSLLVSDPTETGAAGTEVTGGSYARAAVTTSLANFSGTQSAGSTVASSGTSGTSSNNLSITFPAPTANWGTITHIGLMDALTGGNCWAYGAVSPNKTVNNGDSAPSIPAGSFTFQIDN